MKRSHSRPPLRVNRPLTQADIDHGQPPARRRTMTWREALAWIDMPAGPVITAILVIIFALGAYALYSIWGMSEIYRQITERI